MGDRRRRSDRRAHERHLGRAGPPAAPQGDRRSIPPLDGEDLPQVKDIVYPARAGAVGGFTLAGRGLFSGPLKRSLARSSVLGLGNDAVMIAGDDSLEPREDRLDTSTTSRGSGGDVLGSQVLTDTGTDLGSVVDAIIEANGSPEGRCAVVSYEIRSSEALGHKGTTLLIPLPHTVVVSGEHLIVPANATDFVGNDLAGFGAAVAAFRAQLRGQV